MSRISASTLSDRSKSSLRRLQADLGQGASPARTLSSPSFRTPSPPRRSVSLSPSPHVVTASRHVARSPPQTPTSPSSARLAHAADSPSLLPVRPPILEAFVETGPSAGGHLPSHRGGRKYVEARLSDQHHAREGGEARGRLMEAGAHLWLAEELRACASLLTSDGAGDPRVASSRLEELAQALQAEGATQRWDAGGSYGGSVEQSSRAASCLRRANQLRHASRAAVSQRQRVLAHGARGWVTVFGDGGMGACDPTIVPTLLSLADSETALARARPRLHTRMRH